MAEQAWFGVASSSAVLLTPKYLFPLWHTGRPASPLYYSTQLIVIDRQMTEVWGGANDYHTPLYKYYKPLRE